MSDQLGMFARSAEMRRAWTHHLGEIPEVERDRLVEAGELEVPTIGSEELPPGWCWGPNGAERGRVLGKVGAVYGERGPVVQRSALLRRAGLRPRAAHVDYLNERGVDCACIVDAVWHRKPPKTAIILVRRWVGPGIVRGGLVWFTEQDWERAPLVELGTDLDGLIAYHASALPGRRGAWAYPGPNQGFSVSPLEPRGRLEWLDASSANRRPRSGP